MSWPYSILLAVVSAITGGVVTITVEYILPIAIIDQMKERRELMRLFRRSAGPLMFASYQLFRRLQNMLEAGCYEASARSWEPKAYWSMTQSYFIESTKYLFAVFFAYLESYYLQTINFAYGREEICLLFNQKVRDAQRALYDVSLNGQHLPDRQVYLFEQQAMAYAVLQDEGNTTVMDFFTFKENLANDPKFSERFLPIEDLIAELKPDDGGFRFERLQIFAEKLKGFYFFLAEHTQKDVYNLTQKVRQTVDSR